MQTNDPEVRAQQRHRQLVWLLVGIAVAYPVWMRAVDALWAGAQQRQTAAGAPVPKRPDRERAVAGTASLAEAPKAGTYKAPPGVRVVGASAGRRYWMVLVELEGVELVDAGRPICREAERKLQRDVSGVNLRVERYRGTEPALTVGRLMCP